MPALIIVMPRALARWMAPTGNGPAAAAPRAAARAENPAETTRYPRARGCSSVSRDGLKKVLGRQSRAVRVGR